MRFSIYQGKNPILSAQCLGNNKKKQKPTTTQQATKTTKATKATQATTRASKLSIGLDETRRVGKPNRRKNEILNPESRIFKRNSDSFGEVFPETPNVQNATFWNFRVLNTL